MSFGIFSYTWLYESIGTRYMRFKRLDAQFETHISRCIVCRDYSEMEHAPECLIAKGMMNGLEKLRHSMGVN